MGWLAHKILVSDWAFELGLTGLGLGLGGLGTKGMGLGLDNNTLHVYFLSVK